MLAFTLNGRCFFIGGGILNELAIKELIRSKEEKRILTGKISGSEDEYYKSNDENIYTTEKSYNLCINFKKIDNNKYCFDVSSITGKSIEVLEQIINKYKK